MQHPLLLDVVVLGLDKQTAFLVGAVRHDVEVNIGSEGVHLAVAVHDFEVRAQEIRACLVLLGVGNRLVINHTVLD